MEKLERAVNEFTYSTISRLRYVTSCSMRDANSSRDAMIVTYHIMDSLHNLPLMHLNNYGAISAQIQRLDWCVKNIEEYTQDSWFLYQFKDSYEAFSQVLQDYVEERGR